MLYKLKEGLLYSISTVNVKCRSQDSQKLMQVQNERKCSHYDLECVSIMKLIWAISFTSLWGTMMSVGTFHASYFWGSLRKIPWYVQLLSALMVILLILGFVVGLGPGSGTSMLMMVCICNFFPALLWVLMTHIKLQYQSRTSNSLERAQAAAAAMLELPGGTTQDHLSFSQPRFHVGM